MRLVVQDYPHLPILINYLPIIINYLLLQNNYISAVGHDTSFNNVFNYKKYISLDGKNTNIYTTSYLKRSECTRKGTPIREGGA